MGFRGLTVHHPFEVNPALAAALREEGPVLINIMTNPEALAMPPSIEWAQVRGYALSMSKMILGGRMDDVWESVKANYRHIEEVI
jgi:pyruvate dehydrogenase (quinone)